MICQTAKLLSEDRAQRTGEKVDEILAAARENSLRLFG